MCLKLQPLLWTDPFGGEREEHKIGAICSSCLSCKQHNCYCTGLVFPGQG